MMNGDHMSDTSASFATMVDQTTSHAPPRTDMQITELTCGRRQGPKHHIHMPPHLDLYGSRINHHIARQLKLQSSLNQSERERKLRFSITNDPA
eukprot:5624-Eustigmatos_ZCMA.PRE.1